MDQIILCKSFIAEGWFKSVLFPWAFTPWIKIFRNVFISSAQKYSILLTSGKVKRQLLPKTANYNSNLCHFRFYELNNGRIIQFLKNNITFWMSLGRFPTVLICFCEDLNVIKEKINVFHSTPSHCEKFISRNLQRSVWKVSKCAAAYLGCCSGEFMHCF